MSFCPVIRGVVHICFAHICLGIFRSTNWPGLQKNSLLLLFGTAEFTVPQMKMHWEYIYINTLYIVVQFWFCPPKIVSVRESEIKVG